MCQTETSVEFRTVSESELESVEGGLFYPPVVVMALGGAIGAAATAWWLYK